MRRAAAPVAGPGESGAGQPVTVSRWSRTATGFTGVAVVAVVVLAAVPYFAGGPAEQPLITLLTLSSYGAWYLVIVGGLAVIATLAASRGLWGLVADRFGWSLLPVGYQVRRPRG